jgi:hypothetical protein
MSKRKKIVINRVETLEGEGYTHAVYYTDYSDSSGCPSKFMCYAKDELDAYQQAKHHIGKESNNVIQDTRRG